MSHPQTIFAATVYTPVLTLLEKTVQGTGMVIKQLGVGSDAIKKASSEAPGTPVVLYAKKGSDDWLEIADALRSMSDPHTTVVIGESSDIGLVAKGILHGVTHFVPLTLTTDPMETMRQIADALSGKTPSTDSIYGRVKAMLPSATSEEGKYVAATGKVFSTREAIDHCVGLGLTSKETARLLGVSEAEATKTAAKPRLVPRLDFEPFVPSRRLKVGAAILAVALILLGFEGQRRVKNFVPVSGRITVNGVPLGNILVYFKKEGGAFLASGRTDGIGNYTLSTIQQGDGVEQGHHVVWLGLPSRFREHIEMNDPEYTEKMFRLTSSMASDQAQAKKEADSVVIPVAYRDMQSSPLRADIKGRQPMRQDFDLKR